MSMTRSQIVPLLDIGGEGRYITALNLNPSDVRTLGSLKGSRIPNRLEGKAEKIPLPDGSVQTIVMERTPLCDLAIEELKRVAAPDATIVLRHHVSETSDPHARARSRIKGKAISQIVELDGQVVQQTTIFRVGFDSLQREGNEVCFSEGSH